MCIWVWIWAGCCSFSGCLCYFLGCPCFSAVLRSCPCGSFLACLWSHAAPLELSQVPFGSLFGLRELLNFLECESVLEDVVGGVILHMSLSIA